MDLNNFRAAVEPILDRYETRFARDSLPDQFVRGRTRTKTLGAIAIKVDERRLRAICGVLTRFAAYFGPNHIVRSAAELDSLNEYFNTVRERAATRPEEDDPDTVALLDEGALRAHVLRFGYRRLCAFVAEKNALTPSNISTRTRALFQALPDASAPGRALTAPQFNRICALFEKRMRVMHGTTATPPPGGHELDRAAVKEILGKCLPSEVDILLQLELRSMAEVNETVQRMGADGQAIHSLLSAEFKNDYLDLYRNVMTLCALDPRLYTRYKSEVQSFLEKRRGGSLDFAAWRHLREDLDRRQLDLHRLASQRLAFGSEDAFKAQLAELLLTSADVRSMLDEHRDRAHRPHAGGRSQSPVDTPLSLRARTPIRSPHAFQDQHHSTLAASHDAFGEAPASPGLPSAHMDLPDLPDLFDHFSLGARPALGLRAARHYRTTPAKWAASRRW